MDRGLDVFGPPQTLGEEILSANNFHIERNSLCTHYGGFLRSAVQMPSYILLLACIALVTYVLVNEYEKVEQD